MNDKPGVMAGRRRGRAEIEQIVAEFAASGVRRTEFCRRHGMTLGTLHRYLKLCEQPDGGAAQDGLLAVELAGRTLATDRDAGCGLAVVLSHGRRIEVEVEFDAPTLERLVTLLEKM